MTGREWKPGDVAAIPFLDGDHRAMRREDGSWYILGKAGGFGYIDARPLVVIDPEDRKQVQRLYDLFSDTAHESPVDGLQAALREFAGSPPSKPAEPRGQGAVVEDASGRRWLRRIVGGRSPWAHYDEVERTTRTREWDEIDAVRVLSEGVQP